MGLVERQFVSIDSDLRTLRVVAFAVRSKGGVRIRKVLSVAVPPHINIGDPAPFGKLVREVLHREGIGAGRMVVDVPRDQAVLNTLKLPAVSEDDLPSMVEFQIAKELPFPLADAVTDFAVPGTDDDTTTRDVLVAAVRHDVLDYYRQTADAAGLRLERVGLRPYANRVAVNELLGDTRHERVLFVDVGPALTEIDVLRDGQLAFSRAASVLVPRPTSMEGAHPGDSGTTTLNLDISLAATPAGATIPDRDNVVHALLREVALTLEAYRAGDPGADVNHVVVGGDTGVEDDLLEAVRGRFKVSGERYNPTACFGWDGESGAAAGGFAAALGLALGHAGEGRLDFDFIHPKRAVSQSVRRLRRAPIAATAALFFIAAAALGYHRLVGPQKDRIAYLEEQIADAEGQLKELKKFGQMFAKVEEFEREQIIWLDELTDFLSVWPERDQVTLTRLDLSQRDRSIQLKMDFKDREVPILARDALDEFTSPDGGGPRFDAKLGPLSDRAGDSSYPVKGSMTIKVIGDGG